MILCLLVVFSISFLVSNDDIFLNWQCFGYCDQQQEGRGGGNIKLVVLYSSSGHHWECVPAELIWTSIVFGTICFQVSHCRKERKLCQNETQLPCPPNLSNKIETFLQFGKSFTRTLLRWQLHMFRLNLTSPFKQVTYQRPGISSNQHLLAKKDWGAQRSQDPPSAGRRITPLNPSFEATHVEGPKSFLQIYQVSSPSSPTMTESAVVLEVVGTVELAVLTV